LHVANDWEAIAIALFQRVHVARLTEGMALDEILAVRRHAQVIRLWTTGASWCVDEVLRRCDDTIAILVKLEKLQPTAAAV
jgi:hypothetical protein